MNQLMEAAHSSGFVSGFFWGAGTMLLLVLVVWLVPHIGRHQDK